MGSRRRSTGLERRADQFFAQRIPDAYSTVLSDIGDLATKPTLSGALALTLMSRRLQVAASPRFVSMPASVGSMHR